MAKVYIDTLGCPKNLEDSERAAGLLAAEGHELVREESDADVIMINTCGFIEDARRESIDRIFQILPQRDEGKKIIVSGCLTQRYGEELFEELPEADAMIGVNDYGKLPGLVSELLGGGETARRLETGSAEGVLTGPRLALEGGSATRYLKIAEGCSNRCSYCAIPMIRGPFRSIPRETVLNEAEKLAGEGAKELILIAQDVSAYGGDIYGMDANPLPELLKGLCLIEGIRWIRLMYCYEERITPSLMDIMAKEEKICPYIDIPLQHCSNRILKAMNRRSTKKGIEDKIALIRARVPGIAIRTTLITGFPGENEDDFAQLEDFVQEQRFERLGVFAFSPEEGTPAADFPDQVPEEVARERRESLMLRQLDISLEQNGKKVGSVMDALAEESDDEGVYVGRTAFDAPDIDNSVVFSSESPVAPGEFVRVKIIDAMDYDLIGERI